MDLFEKLILLDIQDDNDEINKCEYLQGSENVELKISLMKSMIDVEFDDDAEVELTVVDPDGVRKKYNTGDTGFVYSILSNVITLKLTKEVLAKKGVNTLVLKVWKGDTIYFTSPAKFKVKYNFAANAETE